MLIQSPKRASKVPISRKLLWGAGGAADNVLYNGLNILAAPIFNLGLGMDVVKLGWAIGLPRLVDALAGPVIGHLSDNLQTRWGRRRPLIFLGIVFSAFLLGLLFNFPRFLSLSGLFWWLLIVGSLFYLAYAFFAVPYSALGLEMTDDYHERTRVLAWRPFMGLAIGLGIPWLYKLCLMAGFSEADGARHVAWGIAAVALILGILPLLAGEPGGDAKKASSLSFFRSVHLTFSNRCFLLLAACDLCIIPCLFITSQLSVYLFTFYLFGGDRGAAAMLIGASGSVFLGAGIFGLAISTRLATLIGKRHAMLALLAIAIVFFSSTWWLFTPANPWLALIPAFMTGLSLNGCFLISVSMLGDVCDEDQSRTGIRREGIYSASWEFGKKLAIAASPLLAGYILAATGCGLSLQVPSQDSLLLLRIVYILMNGVFLGSSAVLVWFYPLTHARMLEVQRSMVSYG